MTLHNNLSASLNSFREMRELSINEFSQEIGMSKSETQKLLKATGNPRLDTVEHIAENLEVNSEILISPTYSASDFNSSLLLLKTVDCITNLSKEDQERAAYLFHELISLFSKAKED
ncbi:MAG: helix-turn-helix transcriptional regulator [Clostridiales bacterium]|nr:helix-turn-helix transcriptional regulator [Clostridiales bacterium]